MQDTRPTNSSAIWWLAGGAAALGGLAVLFFLVILPLLSAKEEKTEPPDLGNQLEERTQVPVPRVRFTDVTGAAGIHFVHNNGLTPMKLLPETMGSGVAFIDYNNDGHQDILFINSCAWPGLKDNPAKCTRTLALYENNGDGTFRDVTKEVGLDVTMYGMGVTVGDFDNDGNPDIFVTGVGGNRLFRNVVVKGADGKPLRDKNGREVHRFQEVTDLAGLQIPPEQRWPTSPAGFLRRSEPLCWSTSAVFLDYDGDGWLDLFVCNYVTWSPQKDLLLENKATGTDKRSFGPPTHFDGSTCFLYRNKGVDAHGRWLGFEDVSARAGIQVVRDFKDQNGAPRKDENGRPIRGGVGKSLGVAVTDVDGKGFPSILVANDTARNFFFHNLGNGKFEEIGEDVQFAFVDANARGGMGIDAAHYRPGHVDEAGRYQPGPFGVVIGNFNDEPDTFMILEEPSPGRLLFTDRANPEGVGGPSRQLLKFGAMFFDYDLDGRLDLLTNNGQLEPDIKELDENQDYKQPVQLFWNTGREDGSFEPVTRAEAGPDLFVPLVGRGCAFGDIDGDGYPDVVLMENGGPARLLHNEGGTGNHCLRLVLKGDGKRSNTSALGARVTVTVGKTVLVREVGGARGYLSQSELPVTVGLGKATRADRVEIRWPGKKGGTRVLTGLDGDRVYFIDQGKEKVESRLLKKTKKYPAGSSGSGGGKGEQ